MELQGGKYLTFSLGHEEYGIPIERVREIIGILEITHIPKVPRFIKGVINLRGKIIPIMDLRIKFDMEQKEYNERTCIIVVEIPTGDIKKQIGVAVDSVSEVLSLQTAELEPPPEYGNQSSDEFLTGVGKIKGKVILLLNIEKVFMSEDIDLINQVESNLINKEEKVIK